MPLLNFAALNLICISFPLSKISFAQSPNVGTTSSSSGSQNVIGVTSPPSMTGSAIATIDETPTSFRPIFTVPADADLGATLLPNINDPRAVDAQTVCPGYIASNIIRSLYGLSATLKLAGDACNVYGTDIELLNLTVEHQSEDRLSIRITPTVLDASNTSQYQLPSYLIHQPTRDADADMTSLTSDLDFIWSNHPIFSFTVLRVSTGDVLFSTAGTKIVFENQFVEFASSLPENYNLYGLGETIHGLRLGNNFTKTIYAADAADPIDAYVDFYSVSLCHLPSAGTSTVLIHSTLIQGTTNMTLQAISRPLHQMRQTQQQNMYLTLTASTIATHMVRKSSYVQVILHGAHWVGVSIFMCTLVLRRQMSHRLGKRVLSASRRCSSTLHSVIINAGGDMPIGLSCKK